MDNQFIYHSRFGDQPVKLSVASYAANPLSLAISLTSLEDGAPFSVATVNIGPYTGNGSLLSPYCAFIDTNNLPEIESFLIGNGLAEPYTRFGEPVYGFSGFCSYPLYSFDQERLRELDPKGSAAYEQNYAPALEAEKEKLDKASFGMDFNWFEDPTEEMVIADEELAFDLLSEFEINLEEGREL